jgi:ADP-ribosyl-[dinitrogen reductase] hydrolase
MNKLERIENALWAQAVCDAVGDPFEFRTRIDPASVSNYAKKTNHLNITDDTQLCLFGFEAVASMHIGGLEYQVKQSYIDWLRTQDETPEQHIGGYGLLGFPVLHVQRAPGNTCLTACTQLKYGDKVKNDSKGCGSVMRLLPFLMFEDYGECISAAWMSAYMTHQHPENKQATYDYIIAARSCLYGGEFGGLSANKISDLGLGWTAQECVNMAIYAFMKAKTFDELLEISIAHDGDSDSVGAIAGSLWGLAGKEVPTEYIGKLVEKNAIKYCIDNYIYKKK